MRELMPDYARAAAGFVVTAAPLPWLAESPVAFVVAAALAVAFAAYGISTFVRQRTRIEADAQALASDALRRTVLPWDELTALELRYYSVRRDRQRGWMQLRLSAPGRRVTLDSALDGFAEITRRAAVAAAVRQLPLTATTQTNLRALGVEPAGGSAEVGER